LVEVFEVESSIHVFDVNRLVLHVVLEDELLEKHEGSLVLNSLADLDLRGPLVGRVSGFTISALQVLDDVLNKEVF